jgi:endonuclease/exonuclease/phosphatase family metal-dependent hydrolase
MKILLGDLIAKVGKEDIFKLTVGNESLHEISSDNGVRLVNFATSKNLVSRWENPDQIDHILVDRRRLSNVLDVRSLRAADCDSDHYLVVAKVMERLAVNKQRSQ